jgi:microcystin degradation protein MlrC
MKIFIAGFQHETNTFAPTKAAYQNFLQGEGFPPLTRGVEVLKLRDVNVPIGGFIKDAEAAGHALIPVIWAGASASAHVTEDAYERIAGEIIDAVKSGGFDAIYLDLHGAMVAEHIDDGEGELLERVRAVVGSSLPLVVSLDLHANVTEKMHKHADALVAYRTYPHVDMAETGERAAKILQRIMTDNRPVKRGVRRIPFLIPVNGMCTLAEPSRGMYDLLASVEQACAESGNTADSVFSLSFAPGFPAADFPECGPVIWGYGFDEDAVTHAVETLFDKMIAHEAQWEVRFLAPDEAVIEAMRLSQNARQPVIIADTQDNPGVGGDSNTMGMVRTLLYLSDGRVRFDGPMMNGMWTELGPVACLRIDGVKIAVSSIKMQMFERNLYRIAGIDPERMKILVNKSSVHFRADFEAGAAAILVAKAPGPMAADPSDLPWQRLDPHIRLRPTGSSLNERDRDRDRPGCQIKEPD